MLDNIPKKCSIITNSVIFDDTLILTGPVDIVTELLILNHNQFETILTESDSYQDYICKITNIVRLCQSY